MKRLLGRAQPVIPPNLYSVNEHNSLGSPGNETSVWIASSGSGYLRTPGFNVGKQH